ncbi:hypothetical protein BJ508DRAFT_335997 [Ascobolus immersus RN42]|uniref:Uncharacterized protein n=1 Tax=Ascobolus immersus RN42 TaxID=1160509 RepID=A0A3N4HA59_ASCIM|nr:hypothetical protein BJ508DRAFT_335997 [Ascobolus immersus RN42]
MPPYVSPVDQNASADISEPEFNPPSPPHQSATSHHPSTRVDPFEQPDEFDAPVCMRGGPWNMKYEDDPSTLIIFVDNSGREYMNIFEVQPASLYPDVIKKISPELELALHTWAALEKCNGSLYPSVSDEDFDWDSPATTIRSEEEKKRIVRWMLDGLVLIRTVHRILREGLAGMKKEGIERLRISWFPPAFNDPEEDGGWDKEFWFPRKGPWLGLVEMVESDEVQLWDTRVYRLLGQHYPEVVDGYKIEDVLRS